MAQWNGSGSVAQFRRSAHPWSDEAQALRVRVTLIAEVFTMCRQTIKVLIGTMAVIGGLSGCASFNEASQMDKFDKTINTYNALIRWGDYQSAAGYRDKPSPIDAKILKDIRVTSYETKRITFSEDKSTAHVVVEFAYYNEYHPASKRHVDNQTWVYSQQTKVWRLDGDLPKFGQANSR
jgi:hypothetical protein